MSQLIHEYRGDVLENIHRGRICVVDTERNTLYSVGELDNLTYYRSASKPIQVLPIIVRGLHEKYGLTGKELAIMAGSHAGESIHLETILGMLEKTGFSEDDLIMLPAYPMAKKASEEMIRKGLPPRKALHNCAAKHIAAMMLAKELTGDHRDYWRPDCAAQQEIASFISDASEWPTEKIGWGIDGCGVPVFAVPLNNIAISFMKLACPDTVENPSHKNAIETMVSSINKYPLLVRGTGYLCSILNEDQNIVSKDGAQGVYGIGLKKERIGIALKVEDGTDGTWPIIIAEILKQLSYDNKDTISRLEQLAPCKVINDNKTQVGSIKPVFELKPNTV